LGSRKRHDRYAQQVVDCGCTGPRVHDVVKEPATPNPAPFRRGRSGNRGVDKLHDGEVTLSIRRIGDADTPGAPARRSAAGIDISTGIDEKVPRWPEQGCGFIDGVALADPPEVEAEVFGLHNSAHL